MPFSNLVEIQRAVQILKDGGVVAFPTETVYGLGAVALQELAVARIFEIKCRPRFDPLIVHVLDHTWLDRLVVEVPPAARRLAARFWPGPLTLVMPKQDAVPDIVTAGLPAVGVRVPDHPMALQLLKKLDLPLAAPSANPFGQVSPTRPEHVADQLGSEIDLILDGGPCSVGIESTVLGLGSDGPRVLRPGGLPVEEIEAVIGPVKPQSADVEPRHGESLPSPGMLTRHYAPRTRLVIAESESATAPAGRVGLLELGPPSNPSRFTAVETLSDSGDLREAAAGFFAALRRLDGQRLDLIVAVAFPEVGLGRALNDRLRRAAVPSVPS